MTAYARDLWRRAETALRTAAIDAEHRDYDAAASRAYYAAFYAVSALFAREGISFKRHSAVEASVHRDLVKTGRLPPERGADFRSLRVLRDTGDYGGVEHVTAEQAKAAIAAAERIVAAVAGAGDPLSEPDQADS